MTRQGAKTQKHFKDEKQIKSIETWHFFYTVCVTKVPTNKTVNNK